MQIGKGQNSGEDEENGLHIACESGTLQEVLSCLQASGPKIQWYHEGQTPLHVTVLSGRPDASDVISALLEHGADINAQTVGDENTALHLAVLHGEFPKDFEIVLVFLENNSDLTIRNKSLRTPYDCAIANGQYELAGTLDGTVSPEAARDFYSKQLGQKYGPYIIEAVLNSNERKLRESLNLGGDPDTVNKHGAGAIHYTVTHCNLPVYDTLSLLLQHGADPNLQDEEGDSALNLVIKKESLRNSGQMTRCVQLLVDSEARSNICDLDGKDAFKLAEERGYDDVLDILRGKGRTPTPEPEEPELQELSAISEEEEEEENSEPVSTPREDVNAPNEEGLCPIHVATLMGDENLRHDKIETLLDMGAEVSKQIAQTGNTALHLCAEKGYGNTAKLLLDKHIDYTIKNNNGKTAYELATDLEHESVAKAIEEKRGEVQEHWQKAGKKAKFCAIL